MTPHPESHVLNESGLRAATAAVTAEIDRYWKDDSVPAGHEPVAEAAIRAYLASQEAAAPSEEPVAWQWRQFHSGKWCAWNNCWDQASLSDTSAKWRKQAAEMPNELQVRPLFASPAVAPAAVSEDRKTFVVPDGYIAVFDHEGRATGEVVPSPAPVAVVGVKTLEWYETPLSEGLRFEGVAPIGRNYTIQALWHGQHGKLWWTDDCSFPSLEAAKAAAQSDFNARILSSIIPATDPFEICAKVAEGHADLVEEMRGIYPGDPQGALGRDANKMRKLAKAIRALRPAALSAQDTDGVART